MSTHCVLDTVLGYERYMIYPLCCGGHILDKEMALYLGFTNSMGRVTPGGWGSPWERHSVRLGVEAGFPEEAASHLSFKGQILAKSW